MMFSGIFHVRILKKIKGLCIIRGKNRQRGDEMERLDLIKNIMDDLIENIQVAPNKSASRIKKNEYVHSYGTAAIAQILAEKRGLDIEISAVIGYMHDIGRIMYNILDKSHAAVGAVEAEKVLVKTELFSEDEMELICHAIKEHSNKTIIGGSYEEMIKDADVMERYMHERERFTRIDAEEGVRIPEVKKELSIN